MKKILVITDDNSGFTQKEADKLGIKLIGMPILINGKEYFENVTIDQNEFFKQLANDKNNMCTSQPAVGELIKVWENALKEYDQILHIPMSSGLSASCETAMGVAQDYKDKVFVVDNHRISVTLKSSIYDALELIKEGKDASEIKKTLEEEAHNSCIYIMVDTLKYLKKGGRVTAAGALLGGALHVKPVLGIFGGKLDAYAKCIGLKRAKACMLDAIEKDLKTKFNEVSHEKIKISMAYTFDLEQALEFKKEVSTRFNLKDEDILLDPLSLSVGTHIGPGALAVTVTKILH